MLQKLKEQRGEFLLTGAFRVLFGCAALAFGISIFTVMFQANKLTVMANDVTRHIEILGQVGPSANQTFEKLKEASNLKGASVAVDASFSAGGNRIQFGDPFTVTVSYTGKIGIGGVLSLPVPLRSSVVGRSEQYWK
ncbi:DUF4320 family protein [uncultured Oscillibacter sp.]|uniref:DUF4320 family protein n=1 Tax=uncultured Oscillibacter sp. TaxID=876091 RepID=UPI0025DD9E95|nr:DUF4320 family protein [uncultured Oscillibacter sp.]